MMLALLMPAGILKMKSAALSASMILLLVLAPAACAPASEEEPRLEASRALVQSFGARLKGELKKGLEQGGPVAAVQICKDVAPQIASELSRQSGARVMRTSVRYRNPGNAPDDWQVRVLRDFEARAQGAEEAAPLEYFVRESNGATRYMSAIRVDSVCLACHGEVLAPALQERIDAEYPHDRATGYQSGQIRGAFSVVWPPDDLSGS